MQVYNVQCQWQGFFFSESVWHLSTFSADFVYHIHILAKSGRIAHIAGGYSATTTMEDSKFEKETDQTPNIKNTKKVKQKKC